MPTTTPLSRELDLQRCHELLGELLEQSDEAGDLAHCKQGRRLLKAMKENRRELHLIIAKLAEEEDVFLPQSAHIYF